MTRRTLPGTVPGLIRRCSPVIVHGTEAGGWYYPAVVVEDLRDGRVITYSTIHRWACGAHRAADLTLDVDDPTGQDHAMRWIAERMGMAVLSEEIAAGGDVDALIRTVRRLAGGEE